MHRVSNEIIWTGVASVVCGVVIASLIGGAGTPWALLGIVVALGLVVTTVKSRRERRAVHAYYDRDWNGPSEARPPQPAAGRMGQVDEPGRQPALLETERRGARRAGARSQSLGSPPRRNPPN